MILCRHLPVTSEVQSHRLTVTANFQIITIATSCQALYINSLLLLVTFDMDRYELEGYLECVRLLVKVSLWLPFSRHYFFLQSFQSLFTLIPLSLFSVLPYSSFTKVFYLSLSYLTKNPSSQASLMLIRAICDRDLCAQHQFIRQMVPCQYQINAYVIQKCDIIWYSPP